MNNILVSQRCADKMYSKTLIFPINFNFSNCLCRHINLADFRIDYISNLFCVYLVVQFYSKREIWCSQNVNVFAVLVSGAALVAILTFAAFSASLSMQGQVIVRASFVCLSSVTLVYCETKQLKLGSGSFCYKAAQSFNFWHSKFHNETRSPLISVSNYNEVVFDLIAPYLGHSVRYSLGHN